MAANVEVTDFHGTKSYKSMSAPVRRALARYRRESGVSDENVLVQLRLDDLANVDESVLKRAQKTGQGMLIVAMGLDVVAVGSRQPMPVFLCTALLLVMTIMWVTGCFNAIVVQQRRLKRRIRSMKAPTFDAWLSENEPELARERAEARGTVKKARFGRLDPTEKGDEDEA